MNEQVSLTNTQQILLYLRGLLPLLTAAAVFLYLRLRKNGRLYPLLAGFAAFLLIAVPRRIFQAAAVFESYSLLLQFVLTAGTAAVFEEPARFLSQRYAMRNYDSLPDALCAGIGNASVDLIIWAILQCTFYKHSMYGCLPAGLLNSGVYESISRDGLPAELLARGLETQGLLNAFDFIFGGICLLVFHMAMSALVQVAVQRTKAVKFLLLAMILRIFFMIIWAYCGTAVILPITAAICYLVYRIRQVHYRIEPDTIITIRMIFIPYK